ncbi:hypothetical protein [Moorena sp. SIO4G3]|uniref:hypothetical protein n=1 Tax=Moorena sp. SIO4G3 TaxID=2607821 RepID=UPI001429850B|nr:hypothetical protein [Moorena sp. SIO4G3]NEO79133.1 hypothetical protein [Moorena sp. SIO4G3]
MGETTAVAHGGNPQDRTASPRPRCIAVSHAKREWGKPRQSLMVCSRSPLVWPTAKGRQALKLP